MMGIETMATSMEDMIGQQVVIYSARGDMEVQDSGKFEGFDGTFIHLRKENGEILLFSIHRVRLMRVFS